MHLSAKLEKDFKDIPEVIYLQTGNEAYLFSVSEFSGKTLVQRKLVREMLFADDNALVMHCSENIQQSSTSSSTV